MNTKNSYPAAEVLFEEGQPVVIVASGAQTTVRRRLDKLNFYILNGRPEQLFPASTLARR